MSDNLERTVIWYVRVDDEIRDPGSRAVTREEWERIQCATESIYRAMPDGSSLYPCEAAGTVGIAIPNSQIDQVGEVDAAFVAAGYKRDLNAPEFNKGVR